MFYDHLWKPGENNPLFLAENDGLGSDSPTPTQNIPLFSLTNFHKILNCICKLPCALLNMDIWAFWVARGRLCVKV